MPDQPSAVSGVLRQPFREQAAFFRQKLGRLVPTRRWDDIEGAAHDTAFMVAGAQKADLLADLAAAVDRAVVEGKSLEAFRKDFEAAVARNDWHGWTGEDTKGGRAWRTRTIYQTNTYVAYAAGRRAQLEAAGFKFWVYKHGGSDDPRPEHLHVFHGLVLPPEHPFWDKHYPPSDWGCSCYVVGATSERGARRLGGDPDKRLPEGWDKPDPKTGEPMGIGRGWGYAPGASVSGAVAAAARKVGAWEYQIGKAFMTDLPQEQRDELSRAYRRLPSVADDLRRYAQRAIDPDLPAPTVELVTLGMLTAEDGDRVRALVGQPVGGFDYSLSRSAIGHVEERHGVASEHTPGQRAVTAADYALLPAVLDKPDEVRFEGVSDLGEQLVRYQRVIQGERYVAIFAVLGGLDAARLSREMADALGEPAGTIRPERKASWNDATGSAAREPRAFGLSRVAAGVGKVLVFEIKGPPQGRRRAGFAFGPTPRHFTSLQLSEAQVEAIRADPLLTVGVSEVDADSAPRFFD